MYKLGKRVLYILLTSSLIFIRPETLLSQKASDSTTTGTNSTTTGTTPTTTGTTPTTTGTNPTTTGTNPTTTGTTPTTTGTNPTTTGTNPTTTGTNPTTTGTNPTTTGTNPTTTGTNPTTTTSNPQKGENSNDVPFFAGLIALSPIILHLTMLIWIWRSRLSVKDALSDKETIRQENAANAKLEIEETRSILAKPHLLTGNNFPDPGTLNAAINADNSLRMQYLNDRKQIYNNRMADADQSPVRVASVSRLIVFMAGHAAVALGSCLASFIIYYMLITKPDAPQVPSLNGFVGVLLALGIGVVPYAVNRMSSSGNENVPGTGTR